MSKHGAVLPDDIKTLGKIPLLSELSAKDLKKVATLGEKRLYKKKSFICFEDDLGEEFYLILEGRVRVLLSSRDGKEVYVCTKGQGEFFGEMAIIEGKPRSATVIAVEQTALLVFKKREFFHLTRAYPQVAFQLLRTLCARLRDADTKIRILALHNVQGRVARTLVNIAQQEGQPKTDGTVIFKRPTHDEIAKTVGASRETVSRALKTLKRKGFFKSVGKQLHLQPGGLSLL